MSRDIIQFIRQKDYKYIKNLGSGACGETVLLLDDIIDEHIVCKKFLPFDPRMKKDLFSGFMNEIKLMHRAFHPNVVRIFNYYVYPQQFSGYILMEYVEGETLGKYLEAQPDSINSLFRQTIEAFCYLQECGILHRDIRSENILVRHDGIVKVIDLGFGKVVNNSRDFRKSISLNWIATQPTEFQKERYDFATEIYFVGKLYSNLIQEFNIKNEFLDDVISQMVIPDPKRRPKNFSSIRTNIDQSQLSRPKFENYEIEYYRNFADQLVRAISQIEVKTKYITDPETITASLESAYTNGMLEEEIPALPVVRCFLEGQFRFNERARVDVSALHDFLVMLRTNKLREQQIMIANLIARLDGVQRWDDDEIPF